MSHDPKTVTIFINTREMQIPKKERLSYEDVVALAGIQLEPNMVATVSYSRGEDNKPSGTLAPGESVKVKEGMRFDVVPSNRS